MNEEADVQTKSTDVVRYILRLPADTCSKQLAHIQDPADLAMVHHIHQTSL